MLEPDRWNPDAAQLAAYVARVGGPANLPLHERERLIVHICQHREPMLGFLLKNQTSWFEGAFDVEAIPALRLTRWFEQPAFSSARTIHELLETLGGASYAKLDFRLDAMRGRPIIVADNLGGPYCLIEGTHRCCEIVRLARRGEVPTETLPFVLGVCSSIQDYTPFLHGEAVAGARPWWVPVIEFLKGTLLTFSGTTSEGQLVGAVGRAWRRILQHVAQYPDEVFRMKPRDFERFIAGCYDHDGYQVTLTSASGDHGIDIIAEKPGVGVIRVMDQMKLYRPGNVVTAEEVRAFLWAASKRNATRCFITTTSTFAPQLLRDSTIEAEITRGFLDLRDASKTFAWLREIEKRT